MGSLKILEDINQDRRRFFGAAAMAVAATHFLGGPVERRTGNKCDRNVSNQAWNKYIVRLAEADRCRGAECRICRSRPADGPAVILLHGWPYDIHTYVDVAPLLASAGYRVIVPYLRGYGTTRFLSSDTMRNGQQAVLAVDTIALMDALKIEKAIVGGCDWGARTANIVAALWPERCKAMVSVSGYLIGNREANKMPLPPKAELQWWYQYYFATERGRAGYEVNRHDFAKLIWQTRFAAVGLRRCHVRSQRRVLRQPGSCRHRHPQLPLAAQPRGRRAPV